MFYILIVLFFSTDGFSGSIPKDQLMIGSRAPKCMTESKEIYFTYAEDAPEDCMSILVDGKTADPDMLVLSADGKSWSVDKAMLDQKKALEKQKLDSLNALKDKIKAGTDLTKIELNAVLKIILGLSE